MGTLNYPFTLTAGQPENVNQLNSNLAAVATVLNGSVDATNLASGAVDVAELASALAAVLGVTQSGTVRRGKSIIATEEARTNTAYGTLTTPDRVQNVVLPTDGLIFVAFQALMKQSVASAARAAIFLGANQVKMIRQGFAAPQLQEVNASTKTTYQPISTTDGGLAWLINEALEHTSDVTTGQILGISDATVSDTIGAVVPIFAAAGTYDVSVQFKASSGSISAKERKLWVWTTGF